MPRLIYKFLCFVALVGVCSYSIWLNLNPSSRVIPFGSEYLNIDRNGMIRIIVLVWLIGPPVALFIDWSIFCRNYDLVKLELIRHAHDLIRNMWVGFLGVLIILFGVGAVFPL